MAPKKADKEKTETKKKARTATSSKKNNKNNTSSSRVKKNKILYNNKIVIKNNKISNTLIAVLVMSLAVNTFTIYHFLTFNHNKVKIVTKIKEKEVIPENIVFLGDSITHRYDLEKYYGDNSQMVNSGEESNTTDDILNNLKERVYNYNPSKVFLLIGTNDIENGKEVDEIVDNIKKIVEEIKDNRPKTKIYIESVYPVDNDNKKGMAGDRKNSEIENINTKLEEYCQKEKISFIDIYSKLLGDEGNMKQEYTEDGLHISEEGYNIITDKLNEYI